MPLVAVLLDAGADPNDGVTLPMAASAGDIPVLEALLARGANVAVSPGIGFGPGGDGHVRFALVENEQRILQAVRSIRRALPELAGVGAR